MSILTHGVDRHIDEAGGPARISQERKTQLQRIVLSVLTMLSMGSVLTALIALKTVIYVWHLHA